MNSSSQKIKLASSGFKSQPRLKQIVEASLQQVSRHGLAQLSLAHVAEQAGLVPSGIYRYFQSKDAVIDASFELLNDLLLDNFREALQQTDDPLEQLHLLLVQHITLVSEYIGIHPLVFSSERFHARPECKEKVSHAIRNYLSRVADILRQGQRQGLICGDLDADILSAKYLALIQLSAVLRNLSHGDLDVNRQGNRVWQVFNEVIANPKKMSSEL